MTLRAGFSLVLRVAVVLFLAATPQAASAANTVEVVLIQHKELLLIVQAVQGLGNDEAVKFFCAKNDQDFWGNIDCRGLDRPADMANEDAFDVTTDVKNFELHRHSINFVFGWSVVDMLDNIPPLGECNCEVGVEAALHWRVSGTSLVMSSDALGASNVTYWRCGSCPFHNVGGALAIGFRGFGECLSGTKPIPGRSRSLRGEVTYRLMGEVSALREVAGVVSASVAVQDVWIDREGDLRARLVYELRN